EARRGQVVAGDRCPCAWCHSGLWLEQLNGQLSKIPGALCGVQHHRLLSRGRGIPDSLVVREDKKAVSDDRAAKCGPELVETKSPFRNSCKVVAPRVGVELVVSQKLKRAAVIGVGSGLDRSVDDAAEKIAKLGGGILRDEVEFLDGVGTRRVRQLVVVVLV